MASTIRVGERPPPVRPQGHDLRGRTAHHAGPPDPPAEQAEHGELALTMPAADA